MPPADLDLRSHALLLDIDGTLLELAPTPQGVRVPPGLCQTLSALAERTSGTVSFVSGRPLSDIDRIFSPLKLPAIGGHGAEIRLASNADGITLAPSLDERLRKRLAAVAAEAAGIILEDKGYSIALHYRLAPERAQHVEECVATICSDYPPEQIERLAGKAVVEVKATAFSKGVAIRHLMQIPPFAGRKPVFLGDDITDLSGFEAVAEFGGLGFSVGHLLQGPSGHFPSPVEVRQWLADLAGIDLAEFAPPAPAVAEGR